MESLGGFTLDDDDDDDDQANKETWLLHKEMMFDGKDSFLLRAGKKEKDWKVEAKA